MAKIDEIDLERPPALVSGVSGRAEIRARMFHGDGGDWLPQLVISGGQTGADRAALDWALAWSIPHGGWCPKGRLSCDGPLSAIYQLLETDSAGYRQRTKLNVKDAEATLIFNTGALDGGTYQTVRFAVSMGKPHLVVQLDEISLEEAAQTVKTWLQNGHFANLNIAGPREEKRPGIYILVALVLKNLLHSSQNSLEKSC